MAKESSKKNTTLHLFAAFVSIALACISIALAVIAIIDTRITSKSTQDYLSEIKELSGKIEYVATKIIDQQIELLREKDAQLGRMIDGMTEQVRRLQESQQISESLRAELDRKLLELQQMKKELEGFSLLPESLYVPPRGTVPTPTPDSSERLKKLFSPDSIWPKNP